MKKVFYLLLSVLFLLPACSDDKDEVLPSDEYKTVKVVVTRESEYLSDFSLGTILTIDSKKGNSIFNKSDFDMVEPNDENTLLLIKAHNPVTPKYEVELKQKEVKIQVYESPMLDLEDDEIEVNLTTKFEIFVDGKLKHTQNFVFKKDSGNTCIVQYSEK